MKQAVESFAQRPEHASSDSTFVVIMSHGKRDAILGVHHKADNPDTFPVDEIYHHLNSKSCPSLRNKPKVILIQACRGGMKILRTSLYILDSLSIVVLFEDGSLFRGAWARVGQ